jgi:hypothetical protein
MKVAQIIPIFKLGKPPHLPTSYRPISLLPILSKVFEKLPYHRLIHIVENELMLPDHQFGFHHHHSTIQQTHQIANKIKEAIQTKQICSAAFLDISQAFDKVWHTRLLYKLRLSFPLNYFILLKSYLTNRHFRVKVDNKYSDLLYTSDLPSSPDTTAATFADDTTVLAIDPNAVAASQKLQTSLDTIHHWLSLW